MPKTKPAVTQISHLRPFFNDTNWWKATKSTGIKRIAIGGGVSANSGIRQALLDGEQKFGWTTYIPKFEYTTDNAAMIGIVGYLKYLEKDFSNEKTTANARFKI